MESGIWEAGGVSEDQSILGRQKLDPQVEWWGGEPEHSSSAFVTQDLQPGEDEAVVM